MKTRHFIILLTVILITGLLLPSCSVPEEHGPLIIGISKALPEEYYGNYAQWINTADSGIVCVDLYHMPLDSALIMLDGCSGLLISGGPDVYPGRYGRAADTVKCGTIDYYRDTLEFALIGKAKELEMPVLGICRGLQIFNVYHGGSLYADIPIDFDTSEVHRCKDTYNCDHELRVTKKSGLYEISAAQNGWVNSNHHQGIQRIGTGIRAIARTNDGLIEAIEYDDPENMPFFMGVQWHPERMDIDNPFSLPIARAFILEAKLYRAGHQFAE